MPPKKSLNQQVQLYSLIYYFISGGKELIGIYWELYNEYKLQSTNVTKIPDEIPAGAKKVYITGTMITELRANIFAHLSKLSRLELDDNQISVIEPGAFNGLVELKKLSLGKNKLESLEPGTFSGLSSLIYLNLMHNDLTTITSTAFEGLPRPFELHLHGNPLVCNSSLCWLKEEIRKTSIRWRFMVSPTCSNGIRWFHWENCHDIIYNLPSKNATEIPDDIPTASTHVYIKGNMITKLKANVFQNLSNCKNLILDENQITEIEPGVFNGLVKLKELHLNRNQLILKPDMFSGLSSLTHLSLDGNKLTSLEPGIFSGLPLLTSLSLQGNNFTTIDANAFKDLPRPLSLSLANNPLECTDSLCWLKEEKKAKSITWPYSGRPTCSSGISLYAWKSCQKSNGKHLFR